MTNVRFSLDRKEVGRQILKNNSQVQSIERQEMRGLIGIISAQFLQEFGYQGVFRVKEFYTDRFSVKIEPADAKTAALLKKSPGWLDKFIDNLVV